jgi:hypothetical protein
MLKECKFDKRRCFRFSCDFVDSFGYVCICSRYCGGDKFTPRKIVGSHFSIFDLWLAVKRKRGMFAFE